MRLFTLIDMAPLILASFVGLAAGFLLGSVLGMGLVGYAFRFVLSGNLVFWNSQFYLKEGWSWFWQGVLVSSRHETSTLFLFSLVSTLPIFGEGESDLVLCGMNRVFILDGASGKQTWEWTAESSPVVPIENRKAFATTDECKVYQDLILITSSSGGVALVERKTKKSRFFTTVRNAHSACLLPGQLIAVAASFGGDEVRIFNQTKSGAKVIPKMIVPLYGAHGVEWDGKRKCLWALGTKELLKISIARDKATVQNRFELPASGGHDLSWWDQTN